MIIDFGNRGNGGGSTGGGIGEAPKNGKLYGRKDGTWSEVPEGAIGIWIPDYNLDSDSLSGVVINTPLTEEQKQENIASFAKLGENTVCYLKDNNNIIYTICNRTFMEFGSGFPSFLKINYRLYSNIYHSILFDLSTGDFSTAFDDSVQAKLESGINIKTINGKSLLDMSDGTDLVISGGGSGEAPIEVVVPAFDFRQNPITIKYDIKPEDKTANIAASTKITEKINAGETPNVVVRDDRKFNYFTPWKVNVYRGKVSIVAMQEMYKGRNEIVGYNIEADGSITAFSSWNGVDKNDLKTINGESIVGSGDIVISGGGIADAPVDGKQYARQDGNWVETVTKTYVDEIVGTANNRLNLI